MRNRRLGHIVIAMCTVSAILAVREYSVAQTDGASEPGVDLPAEQKRLADRYDRLEQIITRLAELSSSTDPNRAKLLREAVAQARERDVAVRMDAVVRLLGDRRYATASSNQVELTKDLQEILRLLLKENRGEELERQKQWLKKQLKEVGRIIRLQRGVKARTEEDDDAKQLADDQSRVTDRTTDLGDEIESAERADGAADGDENAQGSVAKGASGGEENEEQDKGAKNAPHDQGENEQKSGGSDQNEPAPNDGGAQGQQGKGGQSDKPGDGGQPSESSQSDESDDGKESPLQKLRKRIRAAQQDMQRAQDRLEKAEREGAADAQEKAIRELEQAKAELERILRQLREEEMERTLAMLEARFRKMLDSQLAVYEGTIQLDGVPADKRNHGDEIEAGRLSRQEALIVHEADKVLALLRDDGTSVAFPETVEQMQGDMRLIVSRLAEMKAGAVTQGLEEDVIEALEELIAAVQKAERDLEQQRTPPGESPPPGEPQDPPLVRMLAELRMIRALQARVKRRTERYSQMIEGAQAEQSDLIDALARLSDRQLRIEQATHDLQTGKNR